MNRLATLFSTISWTSVLKRIANMAAFYAGWWICMKKATGSEPYTGPIFIAGYLICHLFFSTHRKIECILIVILSLIGTVVDSLYIYAGIVSYEGGYTYFPSIAPLWITALWALYASSINQSLEWLKYSYYLLAVPLGAAGAISSYAVGVQLKAAIVHIPEWLFYTILGVIWAVVVPLSLHYNDWLKQKN